MKLRVSLEICLFCHTQLNETHEPIGFWRIKRCERCKRYWLFNLNTGEYKVWFDRRKRQHALSWQDGLCDFTLQRIYSGFSVPAVQQE